MTFNPSVELYVVSPDGDILADAAPPGHIQRQSINLAPVQEFLSGAAMPVLATIRVARTRKCSARRRYVRTASLKAICILFYRARSRTRWRTWRHKALWSTVLWSMLWVALFGLLAGLLIWYWVTRPVKRLTREVAGLEHDSMSAIRALAVQQPDVAAKDEVALLRNNFIELARKITHQWDQLADSDRQRREFIANISHDLRTPLTSLLGYLETLSLKSATLTPQEHQQYLATALRQGQKVRHLSQQLFELARLEHGGIKPQRERFAMGELISDVAQKFELTARTRELQLQIDVPGPLPLVYADVSMIERVVTNLLDNAIRHTPTGGKIRLAVWQENEKLQVEVADSGTGVDAALRRSVPAAFSVESAGHAGESRWVRAVDCQTDAGTTRGGIRLMESVSGARFRFFVPL